MIRDKTKFLRHHTLLTLHHAPIANLFLASSRLVVSEEGFQWILLFSHFVHMSCAVDLRMPGFFAAERTDCSPDMAPINWFFVASSSCTRVFFGGVISR